MIAIFGAERTQIFRLYKEGKGMDDLIFRLRKRAEIRRSISTRKSVQEGQPDRIADLLEEAAGALGRYADAAPLCDKHKPKGGKRAVCLACALVRLEQAMSRIDYLCGDPNEYEVSGYDLHRNEEEVIRQVANLKDEAFKHGLKTAAEFMLKRGVSASKFYHDEILKLENESAS